MSDLEVGGDSSVTVSEAVVLETSKWRFPIWPIESKETVENGQQRITYRSVVFDGDIVNVQRASFHTGTGELMLSEFTYKGRGGRRLALLSATYREYTGCSVDEPADTLSHEITAPEPPLYKATENLVLGRDKPVRAGDTKFICAVGEGTYYKVDMDTGLLYVINLDERGEERICSVRTLVSLNQYQSGSRYQLVMAVEK